MKKRFILFGIFSLSLLAFGKIQLTIAENLVFKKVNAQALGEKVVAKGSIEISTDNLEEDMGKMLKFEFPAKGAMTNRKNWINIESFHIENDSNEYIVTKSRDRVNFYGIIDRREIGNSGETPPELLEGQYLGAIPIVVTQFGRAMGGSPEMPEENEEREADREKEPQPGQEGVELTPEISGAL